MTDRARTGTSLLECVRALFVHDPARYRRFVVGEVAYGWVETRFAAALSLFGDVFEVTADRVALHGALEDPEERTDAVREVTEALQRDGQVPREPPEPYAVVREFGEAPAFLVDRAMVPFLGVPSFGVHLNGYVVRKNGLHVWVGRRSARRSKSPGKLDHLVAGGQPAGMGPLENLVKECEEEAGVPADLARRAVPAGRLSYRQDLEHGLRNDTLFLYDLEVPADFEPKNRDGEIDEFFLWAAPRVLRSLQAAGDWKYNVAPVVLDFLVRRGEAPESSPPYAALRGALDRGPHP